MRRFFRSACLFGLTLGCLLALSAEARAQPTITARWSAEFADSVGVNTHFIYADTAYALRFDEIKARLVDLGVRHIRDGAYADHNKVVAEHVERFRQLGRAGIRGAFIFDPGVSRQFVQAFPAHVAPAFEAYELPNEYNLNGGPDWAAKLRNWMGLFHGYVHSSADTAAFPIIGPSLVLGSPDPFTIMGNRQNEFDFGNEHIYFAGRHPGTRGWGDLAPKPCQAFNYGSIDYTACLAARLNGNRPVMVTETGWSTVPGEPSGVPPVVQARYIPRILLLQFNRGVRRTYIYQLVDAGGDEGHHHGLLTAEGKEKPAFHALRSLLQLSADKGGTGSAGSLAARIEGQTAHVEKTLLRRSDGSYRLLLWVEQPSFDPTAKDLSRAMMTVAPQQVTVTLTGRGTVRGLLRLQDNGNFTTERLAATKVGQDTRVQLDVTDNLAVLDIALSD